MAALVHVLVHLTLFSNLKQIQISATNPSQAMCFVHMQCCFALISNSRMTDHIRNTTPGSQQEEFVFDPHFKQAKVIPLHENSHVRALFAFKHFKRNRNIYITLDFKRIIVYMCKLHTTMPMQTCSHKKN